MKKRVLSFLLCFIMVMTLFCNRLPAYAKAGSSQDAGTENLAEETNLKGTSSEARRKEADSQPRKETAERQEADLKSNRSSSKEEGSDTEPATPSSGKRNTDAESATPSSGKRNETDSRDGLGSAPGRTSCRQLYHRPAHERGNWRKSELPYSRNHYPAKWLAYGGG